MPLAGPSEVPPPEAAVEPDAVDPPVVAPDEPEPVVPVPDAPELCEAESDDPPPQALSAPPKPTAPNASAPRSTDRRAQPGSGEPSEFAEVRWSWVIGGSSRSAPPGGDQSRSVASLFGPQHAAGCP